MTGTRLKAEQERGCLIGATVLARWSDDRVLLEVDDGRSIVAITSAEVADVFDIGDRVCVVLSPGEMVDRWWVDALSPPPEPPRVGRRGSRFSSTR